MIQAHISEVVFSNGLVVTLQSNSILVILGPNNSGKSVTLGDIKVLLSGQGGATLSLSSLRLQKSSSLDKLLDHIKPLEDKHGSYSLLGFHFDLNMLTIWWQNSNQVVGPFLASQLISDLSTRARLSDCDPVPAQDLRTRLAAGHPFQRMYRDPSLETKTSAVVRRAFKQDLVVHRSAGSLIPVYIGERPTLEAGEERDSLSYSERIEVMPELEKQGDGIRSFVSVVARVLTEDRSIQLIDEPEAFLHPPQARLVAETVAAHGGGRQTIIATHSREVVQGLLSDHSLRVSVVRLTRQGGMTSASYLPSESVAALWRDPILRFSNVLDGLFHDGVVVTEADADCRFYEALTNAAVPVLHQPDIHYTYSGGKDRLPTVIAALVGLKVPVATIADFDVLNSEQPLRRIFEAHGGDWSAIVNDWIAVRSAVEAKEAFLGGDQFRHDVSALLKTIGSGQAVPKAVLSKIKQLAKRASPWDNIKNSGLSAIQPGTPTVIALRLLQTLSTRGVFVTPLGEMEGFCRAIGGHGPRWVEEVLKRDLAADADFSAARDFAGQIVKYLRDNPVERPLSPQGTT